MPIHRSLKDFDLKFSPEVKARESQFTNRLNNAKSKQIPKEKQWNLILNRLYSNGWENDKLQKQQGNLLLESLNWTMCEYNPDSFVPEINAIDGKNVTEGMKYDKIIKAEWKRLNIPDKNLDLIKDSLIYGIGIQRIYFDPSAKINSNTKGLVRTERISPADFLMDPNATKMEDADFFMIHKKISFINLFNLPTVQNNKTLQRKILYYWIKGQLRLGEITENKIGYYYDYLYTENYNELLQQIENVQISLYYYYFRDFNDLDGKLTNHLTYYNGLYAYIGDSVQLSVEKSPFDFFPFALYWQNKEPNGLYGTSFLSKAYLYQIPIDHYNETTSRILQLEKYPILLMPESKELNETKLNEIPEALEKGEALVKVIQVPPSLRNPEAIKYLNSGGVLQWMGALVNEKLKQAKEDLNLTGVRTAQNFGSLTTTGGVQAAQQQSSKYYEYARMEMVRYCKKLIKILLHFIKHYYTSTRDFVYELDEVQVNYQKNKNPKVQTISFKGSDIDLSIVDWGVKINALTKSDAERQSYNLLQLSQLVRQYQTNPGSLIKELDLIKGMDLPNKAELIQRASLNDLQNKLQASERIVGVVQHFHNLQLISLFKQLAEASKIKKTNTQGTPLQNVLQNEETVKQIAAIVLSGLNLTGDFEKLWNNTEEISISEIIQQIAEITYLEYKK